MIIHQVNLFYAVRPAWEVYPNYTIRVWNKDMGSLPDCKEPIAEEKTNIKKNSRKIVSISAATNIVVLLQFVGSMVLAVFRQTTNNGCCANTYDDCLKP